MSDDADEPVRPRLRAILGSNLGRLSLALLCIEFIAGMQSYLLTTLVPIIADELGGRQAYGVINAAAPVASFLTMPLGAALVARFGVRRLLLIFTWITIVGGVTSALAQGIEFFILGRVITGLATGALATVSMSAIVRHLPQRWRQLVLAGFAATWVVSSLIGPAYAGGVTSMFGWRWAMVLYLPFLLVARWIVSRAIPDDGGDTGSSQLPIFSALILVIGVASLSSVSLAPKWQWTLLGVGLLLVIWALIRLLPSGTLTARRGRPAGITNLMVVTGAYFGAQSIIAIVAYEVLGFGALQLGLALTGSGLAWALTGMWCGRAPASTQAAFRRRAIIGALCLIIGLGMLALATWWPQAGTAVDWPMSTVGGRPEVFVFIMGWTLAGVGIGLNYVDSLNVVFDPPRDPDGITDLEAASAVINSEAVMSVAAGTLSAAVISRLLISGDEVLIPILFVGLAAFTVLMLFSVLQVEVNQPG